MEDRSATRAFLSDERAQAVESQRESIVTKMDSDPVEAIYDVVSDPNSFSSLLSIIEHDDDGIRFFLDVDNTGIYIGFRTGDVGDDGTADMVLFLSWTEEVKRDPPTMKPTKTYYEEQTYVTWGHIFAEVDWDVEDMELLRDHVRGQIEFCAELDDDRYTGVNPRRIGSRVNNGPWGDDITREWIADKFREDDK